MPEIISTAYLMGGLGNQMFQISHALCQGWKNNIKSKFRPVSYTPMQANQPTKYLTNIYRNIEFSNDIPNTIRIESGWQYKQLNPDWDSSIEFFGYYQSNKNFLGYDEKIKEIFQPTKEYVDKFIKMFPELAEEKTVSLHIRRGDYTKISHVLPVVDKTYIDESIKQIGEYTTLFVFSDDIFWVKENLNYERQIIVDGLQDFEELWLMSLCKNNIMSNSTFSWWASFLNKNPEKKVLVPDIWFGPSGESDSSDIYIDSWKKINVRYYKGSLIC